jgi:hypothetical protein
MNETQRLALTAAFLTAVVVAGLSLSLVPHVELVTLTVFCAGVVLGPGRGAVVGAAGMVLYVFANSALRGFPPSPLPVLAVQAAGMAAPGCAGGWWRRATQGRVRRRDWIVLPVLGVALSALYQVLLNGAYAVLLSPAGTSRMTWFVSGMSFSVLDMVWNAFVFGAAGPPTMSALRRMARTRGWWAGALFGVIVIPLGVSAAGAAAPVDTTAAAPDTMTVIDVTSAGADTAAAPAAADSTAAPALPPKPEARPPLRLLDSTPAPMWRELSMSAASEYGVASFLGADRLFAGEVSLGTTPGLPSSVERWGLGWGRTTLTYDGIPLRGPVHGFDDPPDLPLAWAGAWRTAATASGTRVDLALPDTLVGDPRSQVSLTTGSLGRRSAEFALFRNLGPVALGVDFADREEQGWIELAQLDQSRVWVHLSPSRPAWPRWSVDLSTAEETRTLFPSGEMARDVRRVQGSVRVPLLEGEGRLGVQFRRQALQSRDVADSFGEVLFDGFTVQADWSGSGFLPLALRLRGERDRRRRVLSRDRTFDGMEGSARTAGGLGPVSLGAEASAGWKEPYGFTWNGTGTADVGGRGWRIGASVSHEEDLPSMVLSVDRPSPESGIGQHLIAYEDALTPEQRSAVRLEGEWTRGRLNLLAAGWAARVRHYRIDSNPVWSPFTEFAPLIDVPDRADILGVTGRVRLDLFDGVYGSGSGRVHNRELAEVPYASRWMVSGGLHWRRPWFKDSLDLDASVGGFIVGPRENPDGERYVTSGSGYLTLEGRVGNGRVIVSFQNLADGYLESDLRSTDTVTPYPIPGRVVLVGLTMYLTR